MKGKIAIIVAIVCSLAACGGHGQHFQNQAAFESYVAGALHTDARDVHCTKTSGTTARCETDLGTIHIKCQWADSSGGHNCHAWRD